MSTITNLNKRTDKLALNLAKDIETLILTVLPNPVAQLRAAQEINLRIADRVAKLADSTPGFSLFEAHISREEVADTIREFITENHSGFSRFTRLSKDWVFVPNKAVGRYTVEDDGSESLSIWFVMLKEFLTKKGITKDALSDFAETNGLAMRNAMRLSPNQPVMRCIVFPAGSLA